MWDASLAIPVISGVGAAGAAWGAVKVSLNGTRSRVRKIESQMDEGLAKEADLHDRLARLETKIDLLLAGQITVVPPGGQQ
jgi:hypothetical protein